MALSKKIIAAGFAALALLATSVAASAAPAFATGNINVRSGPGTGYRAIDTLRRGERVDVQYCEGSWCFIEKGGPDGWVSASYLDRGRPNRPGPGPGWGNGPGWNNGPGHGPGWGNNRPGWGNRPGWDNRPGWGNNRPGWGHNRPGRPDGSVCFNGPNGYVCMGR